MIEESNRKLDNPPALSLERMLAVAFTAAPDQALADRLQRGAAQHRARRTSSTSSAPSTCREHDPGRRRRREGRRGPEGGGSQLRDPHQRFVREEARAGGAAADRVPLRQLDRRPEAGIFGLRLAHPGRGRRRGARRRPGGADPGHGPQLALLPARRRYRRRGDGGGVPLPVRRRRHPHRAGLVRRGQARRGGPPGARGGRAAQGARTDAFRAGAGQERDPRGRRAVAGGRRRPGPGPRQRGGELRLPLARRPAGAAARRSRPSRCATRRGGSSPWRT